MHSCSHCLRAARVYSCNSVFPRDNSPKPVGFSLHLCPFNLNSSCFQFVNWLCSLWPCYFLFLLHTWEPILFLLDLHPVQYACRRFCFLICRCDASSSFQSPSNSHRVVWKEGGGDSTRSHGPGPCLASDTCDGVHLEVGQRSHASCKLLCRLNADTHSGPPGHSCGIVDAQGQNKAYDILNQP